LVIKQPSTSTTSVSNCVNYTWNGTTYTSSGAYTYSTMNAAGCDSVATLNLTIKQPSTSSTSVSNCSYYVWHGTTYTISGTYTWTGTNAVGCDSVATLNLTINEPPSTTIQRTICANQLPYIWNGQTFNTAENKTITFTSSGGCDSVVTMKLLLYANPSIIMQDTFRVVQNNTITLNGTINNAVSYKWTPPNYLNYDTVANPICKPLNNIIYTLTVKSTNNCIATKKVSVIVFKEIILPNAFSPNGDGINDTWDLSSLSTLSGFTVQIFNRYGNIVFQSKGYTPNWDGKKNGTYIPVGTYYYVIDVPNYKKLSGSITILK